MHPINEVSLSTQQIPSIPYIPVEADIVQFGSEEQKEKYLPKLGKWSTSEVRQWC